MKGGVDIWLHKKNLIGRLHLQLLSCGRFSSVCSLCQPQRPPSLPPSLSLQGSKTLFCMCQSKIYLGQTREGAIILFAFTFVANVRRDSAQKKLIVQSFEILQEEQTIARKENEKERKRSLHLSLQITMPMATTWALSLLFSVFCDPWMSAGNSSFVNLPMQATLMATTNDVGVCCAFLRDRFLLRFPCNAYITVLSRYVRIATLLSTSLWRKWFVAFAI